MFEYLLGQDPLAIGAAVIATASASFAVADYRLQMKNKKLLSFDSLTGLPSGIALNSHIGNLIKSTNKRDQKFAVLSVSINFFRRVNEAHGREAGDFLLQEISKRISSCLEGGEFIARTSGVGFYAVKTNTYRRSDTDDFASKILEVIKEPVIWCGTKIDVSASVGSTVFPTDCLTVEELIRNSETAMFRAKLSKKNKAVPFNADIDRNNRDLSALSIEMRKAIDDGEFEVYYQPQNSVEDGGLVGFEALIRWNHPTRGMVSPAHFIPLAEETGMITEIGAWVLHESCLHASNWDLGLTVSVNVSAIQITRSDLPSIVTSALKKSGLSPSRLELEITESGLVDDEKHALKVLGEIKAMGCSIAMDDFGTGYSSLSSFKRFPFDKIKIDRAFVMDLQTNNQSMAIVNATIAVGKTLNIKVLAEGVEQEEELTILKAAGCDEVQGYYFGRPVPYSEVEDIIARTYVKKRPVNASLSVVKSA